MNDESPTVIAEALMDLARSLAADNPGKSVTVTLCTSIYHTPSRVPDIATWGVQIGHSDNFTGPTFDECLAQLAAVGSPESKRAKAADLRRQADALESDIDPT